MTQNKELLLLKLLNTLGFNIWLKAPQKEEKRSMQLWTISESLTLEIKSSKLL